MASNSLRPNSGLIWFMMVFRDGVCSILAHFPTVKHPVLIDLVVFHQIIFRADVVALGPCGKAHGSDTFHECFLFGFLAFALCIDGVGEAREHDEPFIDGIGTGEHPTGLDAIGVLMAVAVVAGEVVGIVVVDGLAHVLNEGESDRRMQFHGRFLSEWVCV